MISQFLFSKHLEEDEELVAIVHKHWLIGVRFLLWPSLLLIAGALLLAMNPSKGLLTITAVWTLVIGIWWLRNFFDYYLDAWIITDQGIMDIAWHGWFHRESTRVLYSDLQGVSYEIHGVVATLLRYGTMSIEKISTGDTLDLEYVARPKKVEMLILRSMETYLHSKNMKDATQIQDLLSALIAERMQMQELEDEEEDDEDYDDDEEYEDDEDSDDEDDE